MDESLPATHQKFYNKISNLQEGITVPYFITVKW